MSIKEKIKDILKPIEANVVGVFWKSPELYFDYHDLSKELFKNPIWLFFYTLGQKVARKGIKILDEVSVEVFLQDKSKSHEKYKEYGGYDVIENLNFYSTIENADSYISELKKWAALYEIADKLIINENTISNLSDLNVNELYDYFNAQLNNIFINADDGIETHNLEDDLLEIIDEADSGLNVGMEIPSKILNSEIGGVMDGQIYLLGGLSGTGKTTATIQLILSAVFENEEACVVMLNEQDHVKWKQELLTWIINNKIDRNEMPFFNKKRWRQGKFTKDERVLLANAKDYLEQKMINNKIILCHFKSYSRKQSEKIIKKYASLGVKKFVLDTFKISSDRDNNESFWLSMQEDMRKFDDLIKASNLNVHLWITLQLQKGSVLKRYLTGDSIGMAKNVIDVATVGMLMRRVRNDEYAGGKWELKVIEPIGTNSSITTGREVVLNPNKKYVIIFIEKNRNGESQAYQIVAEQDLGNIIYKEVGICDIPFDS
ncbi:helicase [Brevibacillus laterosporus]|uniref:Helicase n=1 Tax=Brevibacillus laterosporus TaxID=1465 RepID=A0A518VCC9_BRELA|nr:helicase [Brevibacillus laterosporus]